MQTPRFLYKIHENDKIECVYEIKWLLAFAHGPNDKLGSRNATKLALP